MREILKKNKLLSLCAVVLISVTWVNLNHERGNNKDVIKSDVNSYYSYLPAFFYEQDLSLSFLKDTINKRPTAWHYWPNRDPNGNKVIKMSMGMAVSYLPFFVLAHIYAKSFNYPADGFSEPYHWAVLFSSLVYFLIGLLFCWKLLNFYFNENTSLITLFCICFGTNVFYYLTIGGGLSHTFGFTLVVLFLYYTVLWHQNQNWKSTLIIGCIFGLMILVRPINSLFAFFFLFYHVYSLGGFLEKLKLLYTNILKVLLLMALAFLVFLPQMLYWKSVTGHYLFNSYVGERFYFSNPHIFYGLFSFRKGWLLYTPIMVFALGGIVLLKSQLKPFLLTTIIFVWLYIYVAFSWWCWWYGGSFGQRALIDIYPVLIIPFAAFITWINQRQGFSQKLIYGIVSAMVLLNLFQTMQAKYNIIHYDSMTRENYFRVFFTTSKKPDYENYIKQPDYEKAKRGWEEY